MSHLKISNHEIELFIRSMKTYQDKLKKRPSTFLIIIFIPTQYQKKKGM